MPDPAAPEPSRPASPVPSWAAIAPAGAATAQGSAARLGALCWAEQQLFALLGGWVLEIAEPDVKAAVAEHAEHAAWRALRWHELLPTAPPGPDALVVAPPGGPEVVLAATAAAAGPGRTLEKLAVAHRVLLPALVVAGTAHLDWASALDEAATRRTLGLALADLGDDVRHGQRLLAALVADADDRAAATAAVAAAMAPVDAALAAAGGILGPGSAGRRPV